MSKPLHLTINKVILNGFKADDFRNPAEREATTKVAWFNVCFLHGERLVFALWDVRIEANAAGEWLWNPAMANARIGTHPIPSTPPDWRLRRMHDDLEYAVAMVLRANADMLIPRLGSSSLLFGIEIEGPVTYCEKGRE